LLQGWLARLRVWKPLRTCARTPMLAGFTLIKIILCTCLIYPLYACLEVMLSATLSIRLGELADAMIAQVQYRCCAQVLNDTYNFNICGDSPKLCYPQGRWHILCEKVLWCWHESGCFFRSDFVSFIGRSGAKLGQGTPMRQEQSIRVH
jgi:hypothetical protein